MDPVSFEVENPPELDRWILSKYNRLIKDVVFEMDQYDHMKAVRKIQYFVNEDLSNWYIRRARRRFYDTEMTEDKKSVYKTTFEVLVGVSKLMAPFAPFLSDEMYKNLTGEPSVHLADFPTAEEALMDDRTEQRINFLYF